MAPECDLGACHHAPMLTDMPFGTALTVLGNSGCLATLLSKLYTTFMVDLLPTG